MIEVPHCCAVPTFSRGAASFHEHCSSQTSLLPRWMISEHPFPWLLPASALMVIFAFIPCSMRSGFRCNASVRHPEALFRTELQLVKTAGRRARVERFGNTLVYTGAALLLQLVLGMAIALLVGPQGLRTSARHAAAGDPARRHRHDVPAHAQWFLRHGARHHRYRAASAGLLNSGHGFCHVLAEVMDAVHGADHAGGLRCAAQGTLRINKGLSSATQVFLKLTLPMMSKVIAIAVLIPRHRPVPRLRLREGDDQFSSPARRPKR